MPRSLRPLLTLPPSATPHTPSTARRATTQEQQTSPTHTHCRACTQAVERRYAPEAPHTTALSDSMVDEDVVGEGKVRARRSYHALVPNQNQFVMQK